MIASGDASKEILVWDAAARSVQVTPCKERVVVTPSTSTLNPKP